jgi:quercetin dioxygenase-like cupin family protein
MVVTSEGGKDTKTHEASRWENEDAEHQAGKPMTDRRAFMASALAGFAASLIADDASAAPSARQVAQRDAPKVTLDGWQVTITEVSYPPGEESGRHRHPGFVCGYVLEGEYRFAVDDQPPRVLKAGETFFEDPGNVHAVSGNASKTAPARILAMVFTPKSGPVTIPG